MREQSESTLAGGGAPAGAGEWVSILVGDAHPVLRLKQVLDWAAITEGMVTQWRRAGKNVEGGPGRPWPVSLYVEQVAELSCHIEALFTRGGLEKRSASR
jgi:hypothetical protein